MCYSSLGNADPILGILKQIRERLLVLTLEMVILFGPICKRFHRNGALSNGHSGKPL